MTPIVGTCPRCGFLRRDPRTEVEPRTLSRRTGEAQSANICTICMGPGAPHNDCLNKAVNHIEQHRRCRKCTHEPMDGSEWCTFHAPHHTSLAAKLDAAQTLLDAGAVDKRETYLDLLSSPQSEWPRIIAESGPGLSARYPDATKHETNRGEHTTVDLSGDWD